MYHWEISINTKPELIEFTLGTGQMHVVRVVKWYILSQCDNHLLIKGALLLP